MSVYTCMDCCIISAVSPVLKGSKIMGRGTAVGCGEGGQREYLQWKDWVSRERFRCRKGMIKQERDEH